MIHEISKLSRLDTTEIHEFIQGSLKHETGVESMDVGLEINVDEKLLREQRL